MDITAERHPRLQIEGGAPFPISSASVDRDVLVSRLRHVTGLDGRPVRLPIGSRITLYTGSSVVFVGRVATDESVIDLLSAEGGGEESYLDF